MSPAVRRYLLACLICALAVWDSFGGQAVAAQGGAACGKKIDDELDKVIERHGHFHFITDTRSPDYGKRVRSAVLIAPMTKKGDIKSMGEFEDVNGGVYSAMLKLAGIVPCETDPASLKGRPGFLEYIPSSNVLNRGATRATFGFFLMYAGGGTDFALFSYDRIKTVDKSGKETFLCATEFFLFTGIYDNRSRPPTLTMAVAVAKNGCLLDEVPIEIAQVSNLLGSAYAGQTVKPGTEEGKGCMQCHERRDDDVPESTLPFPWVGQPPAKPAATVDSCLVGTWRSTSVASNVAALGQTGGSGIVLTVKEDGTETVDYSQMQPIKSANGILNQWSGSATGKIAAGSGKASVVSVDKSDLTLKFTQNGTTRTSAMKGMGPASLGENKPDPSYTCDAKTLTFKLTVLTLSFERQGSPK